MDTGTIAHDPYTAGAVVAVAATVAALRLVSIEWIALGMSLIAIALAGYSTSKAMAAVRSISPPSTLR